MPGARFPTPRRDNRMQDSTAPFEAGVPARRDEPSSALASPPRNRLQSPMQPFRQLDYVRLDDSLSNEERMVRDTVRDWVSERFMPLVAEHFEAGTFPMEIVPDLAELGVFGPTIPEEYGGPGLNNVSAGLIY